MFSAPKSLLGDLDTEATAALITAAADIALIIDDTGIIRDLACSSEELALSLEGQESWLGRAWMTTVLKDSRPKVESILREASAKAEPRWRHLNQLAWNGDGIPILFAAMQVGAQGRIVVFGRDLRPVAALQQRLVEAQQAMEREYSRLRYAETRYRLLFQMASEPVLVVDSASLRIVEANPPARQLFGGGRQAVGLPLADIFHAEGMEAVQSLLATVRSSGKGDEVRARLATGDGHVLVSGSMFRQENSSQFLLRLAAPQADSNDIVLAPAKARLLKLVEGAPDAFVVTGPEGRIFTANAAFLELAEMGSEEQVQGEQLDRWLGRPGVDVDVLMANLRQRGSVRLFATTFRGEFGASAQVEISAVSVMNAGQPCFGFAIRDVGPRLSAEPRTALPPTRSVEQLTELIGRVPLKDLVREATDAIERLCIEAALELSGDNRVSAAEMLGLSRQSLYVKLRRYGLGDLAGNGGDQD